MKLKVKQKAPDFKLADQEGKEHRLADYAGKWVLLYFYPKDDTSGCTKQACGIRDDFPNFKKLKLTVLGVSVDSVKSHAKFAEKYDLPFTLLADEEKKIVKKYGVWGKKKFMGKEYLGTFRASFLIDPVGKIAKIYEKVDPATHAETILADIKEMSKNRQFCYTGGMKTQVVVIHGGDAFDTYKDYIKYLKTKTIDLARFGAKSWKDNLEKDLGKKYQVVLPQMPNKQNAKYSEWKIWFERILALLNKEIILVGHSLGGVFLARYLMENKISKKVSATFLVSAPHTTKFEHPMADFVVNKNMDKFIKHGGKIFLYHSKDDKVVKFKNLLDYQRDLPGAVARIFENRGHFNQEEFPEIVEDIKSI